MFKMPNPGFTAEFGELGVMRLKSGLTIGAVARELGLVEQTLRNWVKAAEQGKLNPPGGKVVTPEQMELSGHKRGVLAVIRAPNFGTTRLICPFPWSIV